jgi:signal transduction histidine kinase
MRSGSLPLSRLTLRFHCPEREAAYRRARLASSMSLLRWALGISVLVQLAYLHLDTLVLGDQAAIMWSIRLTFGIPITIAAFLLSLHPRYESMDQPVAASVVLATGLTTAAGDLLFGPDATMYFVRGIVVVAMYGYVLVGLRFAWAAPLVVGIVALDLLSLLLFHGLADPMPRAAYTLVIATSILTVGAYRMELTSRMEHYTAELLLTRERHERAAEKARIDWLENLAHFLRHEVRNSVTGVRTSIDLLQRRVAADERSAVYFDRARQGLKVIQRLLESASEASSLEASFLQDSIAPLDLRALVAAELDSQRGAHPEVVFARRLVETPMWVEGNPERLVQLLQNLLTNAVDHHRPGTPIRVALDRSGAWARLAVENQGSRLPAQGDAIFDLFASFRAEKEASARRGFGLYLVRLIAERHGGSASAEDLPDGRGVRFEVCLPLLVGDEPPSCG